MALTVQSHSSGASRHFALSSGLKIAQIEIVVAIPGDYVNGYDLDGIRDNLGFEVIWDVLQAVIVGSNGVIKVDGGYIPLYDQSTKKLRFYRDNAVPADAELPEIVSGDLSGLDVLRLLIIGR